MSWSNDEHKHNADNLVLIGVPKEIKNHEYRVGMTPTNVRECVIDQGGCCETSQATTHADPTYVVDDIVHYCVANMPGGVPRTSTYALNNVTLPHILNLAGKGKGYKQALSDDIHLLNGLNVIDGEIVCEEVAEALRYPYVAATEMLSR